jgi:CRISPR-associated protein Cmr2
MNWYEDFLKKFFHDPIDKPLNVPEHEKRAREYAEFFGVYGIEEGKNSDQIASCMERSLLPKDVKQEFTEIRHPLSEEKIDVIFDSQKSIEEISSLLREISDFYLFHLNLSDGEKKALLIWRNLLEEILERIQNEELKKYIPILSADTRVPDHSIWEHLKVTTAINAYENYNSLFLFTIGPVQSFISQARKTQDFYMGSFMLSYFTFIAMEEVIEKYGPTSIIYPDLYKQPLMDWYLKNKELEPKNFNPENLTLPTIPNRFVAIIGTTDGEEIKSLANEMKKKIENEMNNAKDTILNELKIDLKSTQKETLHHQLSDFPQIYWVAIPWRKGNNDLQINHLKDFFTEEKLKNWELLYEFSEKHGEHKPNIGFLYQLLYTALEKSMGARKNLRKFEQKQEAGRKCSVCGERNVLFFWESKNENKKNKFLKYNPIAYDLTDKIEQKYLTDGEGLCALCFLKRTFEIYLEKEVDSIFKDFSFPSVAEVACADFKEKALEKAKGDFEKYEKDFFELLGNDKKFDYLKIKFLPKLKLEKTLEGSWFYEENLSVKKFNDELGVAVNFSQIENLKHLLKNLHDKAGKPKKYYAILYLDGDNMGKWLSGELLPEIQYAYNSEVWRNLSEDFKKDLQRYTPNKILTPAIHSAISTALRNYAIEFVRKIVEEEHLGKLIYAGGDDVLAFVNLKDLFDVMEKLRWAFSGHIKFENGEIRVDTSNNSGFVLKDSVYYLTMGKNATCSMGVVIAHYKEPLKIVIDKVFEMNEKAKKAGRNRFAICLLKHSGEERVGVAEWKIDNELTTTILKNLQDWMNKNREEKRYISDGFIQKLKMEFVKLKGTSISEGIINTELKRLVTRAYNKKPNEKEEEKRIFIEDFVKNAKILFWRTGGDIDNFTNLLEIASFMNKEK